MRQQTVTHIRSDTPTLRALLKGFLAELAHLGRDVFARLRPPHNGAALLAKHDRAERLKEARGARRRKGLTLGGEGKEGTRGL